MLVDSTKESLCGKGLVYVFSDAGVEMQETTTTELVEALIESCEIWKLEYNCRRNRGRGDDE